MNIQVAAGAPAKFDTDLLVYCVKEGDSLDAVGLDGLVAQVAADEEFKGKDGQQLSIHTHGKLAASRLLVLGLGKLKSRDVLRVAAAKAVRAARSMGVKRAAFAWPASAANDEARVIAEGAVLGAYKFDRYLKEKKPLKLEQLTLLSAEASADAVTLGARVGEAVNLARDLVNEPAARMTPTALAQAAREVASKHGLQIEVLGRAEIEKLGMRLFLAVSQGSAQEPQLVRMTYTPPSATGAPLALVGKAITFDSGGLSIKSAQGMEDMKVDMAGAAAVIGAMSVVPALAPPFPVVGYFGACENLPSGTAYKPGDVIAGKNGTTVEVLNTDAEGRLVLADVLAWAVESKPAAVVDLATLTGAILVALGPWTTGLFSNDDALAAQLTSAASDAGEALWRMPLPAEMEELIKSPIADLKNTGGRYGGSINAALFLQRFVGKTPWAHLDIAGPASIDKEKGVNPRGATGTGVRTLVELIARRR